MLNIDVETSISLDIPYEDIITRTVLAALDYVKCPYETEVNVLLTDNDSIREINNSQRHIDAATDVLSFPMIDFTKGIADFSVVEDDETMYFNSDSGELVLGDIVISVEKVIEQSAKYGHSKERELAFLVAHSMLHLSGYDHMDDDERKIMEEKQEDILCIVGYTRN